MRSFLTFAVVLGLGALYYWQKHNASPTATAPNSTTSQTQPASSPQPRQVYEHDWAKHSIDRARDVAQKAAAQTRQSQDP